MAKIRHVAFVSHEPYGDTTVAIDVTRIDGFTKTPLPVQPMWMSCGLGAVSIAFHMTGGGTIGAVMDQLELDDLLDRIGQLDGDD